MPVPFLKPATSRKCAYRRFLPVVVSLLLLSCHSSRVPHAPATGRFPAALVAGDSLTRDTMLRFEARPEAGFRFPYLVYLPKGLQLRRMTYLLVESTNTGLNDTLAYHERGARYAAARSSVGNYVSRRLRLPLLVPVFPRSATNWAVYTHALDRDALLQRGNDIERLDLQLLGMTEAARKVLSAYGLQLHRKFLMTGFSASGTFANRFSLLHPEALQAVAAGGINAIAILPVAELQGTPLNYPLGIADVRQLTGKRPHIAAFRRLPQMLYMGALDSNDAAAFDDAYSEGERETIYRLMGRTLIPQRWRFMEDAYRSNAVGATFITYPHMGHGTDRKINDEVTDFFRRHIGDAVR